MVIVAVNVGGVWRTGQARVFRSGRKLNSRPKMRRAQTVTVGRVGWYRMVSDRIR